MDMSDRPRIMVIGSSNTDMSVKTDHLPQPGETILGGKFFMAHGGKGANQAVAAARLGAEVTFVARIGSDIFGDNAIEGFEKEGIDTRFIVRDADEQSGVALIFVDREGENVIVVAPGSNSRLSPKDVDRAADHIASCRALILQLEVPLDTVEHAAKLAREKGVKVVLNPAPMPAEGLPKGLLDAVDIMLPNQSEVRSLLGLKPDQPVDEHTARGLLEKVRCAVVTMGGEGALIMTREEIRRMPAPGVKVVDTVGAGDAFVGALTVGLSSGRSLEESVEFAQKAAAISVTRMGAQSSLPTAAEVARFRKS